MFSQLVEVLSHTRWRLHRNVARSVDALLAGRAPATQLRWIENGHMMVRGGGGDQQSNQENDRNLNG